MNKQHVCAFQIREDAPKQALQVGFDVCEAQIAVTCGISNMVTHTGRWMGQDAANQALQADANADATSHIFSCLWGA